jgi:thymidylate synthase (FAD)
MKVHYVDHMGSDLSVVNAARVSFGKRSEQLTEKDKGLIRFLARGCTKGDWDKIQDDLMFLSEDHEKDQIEKTINHVKNMPTHWTPFGHTAITLHIRAPIFVARQLGKHQVGMVWNEVSRRYVTDDPEFYIPDAWRKAADNVKQGSSDEVKDDSDEWNWRYHEACFQSVEEYEWMIYEGICPEQARMVLPQSLFTEWYWTGNLYSFANVFIQRSDSHAQKEVQQIAEQIDYLLMPLFPVSWPALTRGA